MRHSQKKWRATARPDLTPNQQEDKENLMRHFQKKWKATARENLRPGGGQPEGQSGDGPAGSKTTSMYESTQHGNRESPSSTWKRLTRFALRTLKGTAGMHGDRQSDSLIVPKKWPNKGWLRRPAAEAVEGRGLRKGNPTRQTKGWTQSQITLSQASGEVQ
jgi:hypothetical protein